MTKPKKIFLDINMEPVSQISKEGVIIEYSSNKARYILKYNYFFGKLLYIQQKDLFTGKTKIYSIFKIKIETIRLLMEFNSNKKYFLSKKERTVRNLINNFLIV